MNLDFFGRIEKVLDDPCRRETKIFSFPEPKLEPDDDPCWVWPRRDIVMDELYENWEE